MRNPPHAAVDCEHKECVAHAAKKVGHDGGVECPYSEYHDMIPKRNYLGMTKGQFQKAEQAAGLLGNHANCFARGEKCAFENQIKKQGIKLGFLPEPTTAPTFVPFVPPQPVKKAVETVLTEAEALVSGERARDYAHPAVNFTRIADMWSVILNRDVTVTEVALCMVALKLARHIATPKRDNIVDAAGYLRALEMATNGNLGK